MTIEDVINRTCAAFMEITLITRLSQWHVIYMYMNNKDLY